MRKLMVGLIAVALAAMVAPVAPAHAQPDSGVGLSDPLGLIVSGAVLPYFGTDNGSQSWLELTSPGIEAEAAGINDIHMFFFDPTCTKGPVSKAVQMTPNDVAILRIDNSDPGNPKSGLVTVGGTDDGFTLDPTDHDFWARIFWFDVTHNIIRMLEPISVANQDAFDVLSGFDQNNANRYNPLNDSVEWFAPLEGFIGAHTTIILVCPRKSVLGDSSANGTKGFTTDGGFPFLDMLTAPNQLHGLIFDDDEHLLVDFTTQCDCLTTIALGGATPLNAVYSDPTQAPNGTFTKLQSIGTPKKDAVCGTTLSSVVVQQAPPDLAPPVCGTAVSTTTGDCSGLTGVLCTTYNVFNVITPPVAKKPGRPFTGYRDILLGTGPLDSFGRLSNGGNDEAFLEF